MYVYKKAVILFLIIQLSLFFFSGCTKKPEYLSFEEMLEQSLKNDLVIRMSKNDYIFHFSVISKPSREKYLGIGFIELKTGNSIQPGASEYAQMFILTGQNKEIFRIEHLPRGSYVMSNLSYLRVEDTAQWKSKVIELKKKIKDQSKQISELIRQCKPVIIQFSDGKVYHGIPCTLSARSIDSILSPDIKKSNYRLEESYKEYDVKLLPVPLVTSYTENRLSYPEEYMRLRRSVVKPVSREPGLITNQYLFAAHNGFFPDYESEINLANESESGTIRFVNDEEDTCAFHLFDIPFVLSFTDQTDKQVVEDDKSALGKLTRIKNRLDDAWMDRTVNSVYIKFKKRPPFIGKLIEYIHGNTCDRIVHAVLVNDKGDYVLLHNPFEILSICTNTSVDANTWDACVDELKATLYDRFPSEPVFNLSRTTPLIYTAESPWARGFTITITRLEMQSSVYIPDFRNPSLLIEPQNNNFTFIILEGNLTLPENSSSKDFYHDEFKLYDKTDDNSVGRYYSMKGFIVLNKLSHTCSIDNLSSSFKLVVMVPKNQPVFYFQFRDSKPVQLLLSEKEIQE